MQAALFVFMDLELVINLQALFETRKDCDTHFDLKPFSSGIIYRSPILFQFSQRPGDPCSTFENFQSTF